MMTLPEGQLSTIKSTNQTPTVGENCRAYRAGFVRKFSRSRDTSLTTLNGWRGLSPAELVEEDLEAIICDLARVGNRFP